MEPSDGQAPAARACQSGHDRHHDPGAFGRCRITWETAAACTRLRPGMDAFLNWCEDPARPDLEHLVAPAEELLDELNSAYSRVAFALPTPARRVPTARRPAGQPPTSTTYAPVTRRQRQPKHRAYRPDMHQG